MTIIAIKFETIVDFINDIDFTTPLHVPGGSVTGENDFLAAISGPDLFLCEMARLIKKEKDIHRVELIQRKMEQIVMQEHYGKVADTAILLRMTQWISQIIEARA